MIVYIARRLLLAISVLFAAIVLTFGLFFTGPAKDGVAYQICGTKCTNQKVHDINHSLGLDKPVVQQFGTYVKGLVAGRDITNDGQVTGHCDAPCLGWSYVQSQSVTDQVKQVMPVTFAIVFGGMLIFVPLGLLLGVVCGRNRGSPLDRFLVGASQVISSMPYYAVALILNLYLIFTWKVLPATGYTPLTQDPGTWFTGFIAIWIIFGLFNAMLYVRYVRAFMINTLSSDFVRTARSKGIPERTVVWRHALRATLAPYLTLIGVDVALQLSGSIFTEQVFNVRGIGRLGLDAISTNDLPVIAGTVLVGATFIVLGNLLIDLLYVAVDPTVKLT
ncbi:MAG TPA: ABC transporter permease [Flexivirga sp.]|uniref:ABC transporter permease n=1 Tax=Flexivirga sp. TaxID=1962927 RepID=UPI002B5D261E|nr:ABC transporter permease [Flexivirga sp.]HWC22035.1 ABC transporter permease [Flexivirga sp.]